MGNISPTTLRQVDVPKGKDIPVVKREHILSSFANTRPSISPSDRAHYDALYSEFMQARGGTPAPDSAALKAPLQKKMRQTLA